MAEQLGPTIEAAEKLKIDYDYTGAREAGLSDADIADYLAAETNYDIVGAREAGVKDRDIITELSTVKDEPITAFSRGVAEGGSLSAGLVTGAMLGAPAGLPGIVGGGLTGLALAAGLNEFFIPDDEFINIGARAAGETFGGSITPLPAPYIAAAKQPALNTALFINEFLKKQGIKPSVRVTPLEGVLRTAQNAPGTFAAYELGAATSAAIAGGGAETTDPGNILMRSAAELGGAVANPMNLIALTFPAAKTGIRNIMSRFSEDTRQYQLGQKIVKAMEEAGENPLDFADTLQRMLQEGEQTALEAEARRTGVEVGKISTAQATQSKVLANLEAALRKKGRLGPTNTNAALQNIGAATDVINLLYQMDDPAAMAIAADMQKAVYESMLQLRLNQAEANALDTAGRAFDGSPEGAAKAGQIITDVTYSVLKEARDQERALYQQVNRTEDASSDSIVAAYDGIMDELLPESPFPSLITRFVNRISGRDADVSEDAFVSSYRETADEIVKAREVSDKKRDTFKNLQAKFTWAEDRVDSELRYGVGIDGVIAEIKADLGSFDNVIRDLSNIAANYREKGLDVVGSDLSAMERSRVASYAERLIDFLQAEQKVIDLQAYQSNYAARMREFEEGSPEVDAETAGVTIGELVTFRSEMLRFARDAKAAGQFRDANFYGRMAEAALDDIGLKTEVPEGEMPTENQLALQAAYNYSRSFNDVFTRAFSSEILGKNKVGGNRLPPELLADKVLGGSANATNLKLTQLQDMARFMVENAGGDFAESSAAALETVKGASESILRTAATRFYNPETGRVNQNALNIFLRDNAQLLKQCPQLRDDLSNAVTADKLLRDVLADNSIFSKTLNDQLAFGAFLGNDETPGSAIGSILGDPNNRTTTPVKNFEATARAANQAGEQVVAGFKSALMDHAYAHAGGTDGDLNMQVYKDYFTKPIARGLPSVMTLMRKHNMMSDAEVTRFNKLLNEMVFVEKNILKGGDAELPAEDLPPAMFELVVSVIGAREGTRAASAIGIPGSIQIPGFFAKFARNRFVNMPKSYFSDLLMEAVYDKKLMETLLRKGVENAKKKKKIRFNRLLNNALINAGFLPAREEIEDIEVLPQGIVRPLAAAEMPPETEIESYLESVSPPPVPQPSPNVRPAPAPVPPSPAPQPVTPSGAGTNTRSQYATMFPNDPIANLIKEREAAQSGGIGSLMGPR